MRHFWLRLAALAAVVACAWAGLAARQDKGEPPDDLAWVPANTKQAVSIQVGKLWDSELGKAFRKAVGDQAAEMEQKARGVNGIPPAEVERLAVFFTAEGAAPDSVVFVTRSAKKLDPKKVLPAVVPAGKEERFGGREVYAGPGWAAFIAPDGRTLVSSHRGAVEALLKKPRRPEGELAAMLRLSSRHHITLYFEPPRVKGEKGEKVDVLPFLKLSNPAVLPKSAVFWLDLGYTSKFGARARFADEKSAIKARKAVEGARAGAGLSAPPWYEQLAPTSKRTAALLKKVDEAVADTKIEQKGAELRAAFTVTVGKKEVDGAFRELAGTASRMQSANNLKQIGLALYSYHDAYERLPAVATYDKGGKPLLSWRVTLLPFLDEGKLYKEFRLDEPWDSPHNKKLIARIPKVYVSPVGKPAAAGGTFYQAFQGKGAIFEGKAGIRLADITDGTSNTILAVEAGKDVPWTKPEDVPFDPAGKMPKLGGVFGDGFNALMADGSVRFLPATIKEATLKAMITRNGGEKVPDER